MAPASLLLQEIKCGSDATELFDGVDIAILVGAKPRGKGMERKDLLQDNAKIFVEQGKAISGTPKVLVVGNPANTNALVLAHNAKNLPKENIRSMMRLDQNRAISQLALKARVGVSDVKRVAVYGNHSPTMVPDYHNALIRGRPAEEVIQDKAWLQGPFLETVKKRGSQIIEARGLSSAASAAHAAIQSIRDWVLPTPPGDICCAGVYDDKHDLFFGMALEQQKRVPLRLDSFLEEKVEETRQELLEEREGVRQYL